jgi:hypothetical protein
MNDATWVKVESIESVMEVNEGSTSMDTTTTSPLVAVKDIGSVAQEEQSPSFCRTRVDAA